MEIKVCKLKEIVTITGNVLTVGSDTIEPILPKYGKEGDACMDIFPIYCEYDSQRDRWIYHTGLAFAIGKEEDMVNEMELRPRSNLTKSDFYIPNSPGTLDWGYRGELLMVFKNRTDYNVLKALEELSYAIANIMPLKTQVIYHLNKARIQITCIRESINTPPYKCDGVDRCAQLLIRGRHEITWKEVNTVEELGTTERGTGGFGSTGGGVKK